MSEPAGPTSLEPSPPSDEERAWALVLASWADEAAHRAYLAQFTELEGYAVAGARYRAVLCERPRDPIALRWRDELVRKATVLGLASLPRTQSKEAPRWVRRLILAVVLLGGLVVVGFAARVALELLGARS